MEYEPVYARDIGPELEFWTAMASTTWPSTRPAKAAVASLVCNYYNSFSAACYLAISSVFTGTYTGAPSFPGSSFEKARMAWSSSSAFGCSYFALSSIIFVTLDTFSPYAIIYENANMSSVDELAISSGFSASLFSMPLACVSSLERILDFYFDF